MNARRTEPTLKDIAQEAGVSVAAVSKVLNKRAGVGDATRTRVLKIMEGLDYQGRSGRLAVPETVSLLTLEKYVANDAFYGDIMGSLTEMGAQNGMNVQAHVFCATKEMTRPGLLGDLGHPLMLVGVDHPEVIDIIADAGTSAVIVNGMDRTMRLSSVSPDYHFGAWRATRHLLDLGHRDIVHVTHPYRETFRRRIDGFRNAVEEAGIRFDPALHLLDLGSPDNISIAARDVIADFLDQRAQPPTAFFCVNDIVALGTIQALQARGLSVPDDVSVIGFDGLPLGAFATPPLSSVQSDRAAVGRIAVSLLAERIADAAAPVQRVTAGVELLLRKSTAPPRA